MNITAIALVSGFIWGGVAFIAAPYAIEKSENNNVAYIERLNAEAQIEQDDDYHASDRAANARYANRMLQKMKGN